MGPIFNIRSRWKLKDVAKIRFKKELSNYAAEIPEQRRSREKTCFLRRNKRSFIHYLDSFRRHAVAQFVQALRYKPEGRGFDSRWCHWKCALTKSFWSHCGPGLDSASNINEYQEYFLGGKGSQCIGLTTLPPSCADCLEIWEPQTPGTLRACPGL